MDDPQPPQQQQQQQPPPPDPASFEDQEDPPSYAEFAINEEVWDIGHLASWTLSSAKPDHGVEALRAEAPELYWQSDGPQPHKLNILFPKRVQIRWICLYLDFMLDESYTPSKVVISAGTSLYDLTEVKVVDLREPRGWQAINIGDFGRNGVIKAFLVQIAILANHQNGKDTHLRGVKVFAPMQAYVKNHSTLMDVPMEMEGSWWGEEHEREYTIR